MRRFRYTQRADAQLVQIAAFSLERFGRMQTQRYMRDIEATIDKAIRHNTLKARPEIAGGVHSVKCTSHVAFLFKPVEASRHRTGRRLKGGLALLKASPPITINPNRNRGRGFGFRASC